MKGEKNRQYNALAAETRWTVASPRHRIERSARGVWRRAGAPLITPIEGVPPASDRAASLRVTQAVRRARVACHAPMARGTADHCTRLTPPTAGLPWSA